MADRGVTTAGVLVGLLIGIPAGIAFAVMRRAFTDWRKTVHAIPGLRKDFFAQLRSMLAWSLIALALAAAMLTYAVRGGDTTTTPARPAPSRSR